MISHPEAGRRLKSAREAANITQQVAADRLGITRQDLSQYERGLRVHSWTRLIEIVATLGLDPAIVMPELFGGEASSCR